MHHFNMEQAQTMQTNNKVDKSNLTRYVTAKTKQVLKRSPDKRHLFPANEASELSHALLKIASQSMQFM